MIKATNIVKRFGEVEVLKEVSLHVKKSEVVSVVGASGAGKSTLLHILGTLDRPDTGTLTINNISPFTLNDNKLSAFRNGHIGFVFQFHHLLPEFSGFENVCIPGYIAKRRSKEVEREARELILFLGISHRLDHKPAQLSGGEQQRFAVARALMNKPDVLFADEPTGNLDSKNAEELHRLFFSLRDEFGHTFVLVTHNDELAEMADRKIQIQDGHII